MTPADATANGSTSATPPIGNFHQPVLAVVDPQSFNPVRAAVEESFSSARIAGFLKSLAGSNMRIRDFETVLAKGLLGAGSRAEYDRLGNADQGQIRELYLARLEQVAPELRQRFLKLYAYY